MISDKYLPLLYNLIIMAISLDIKTELKQLIEKENDTRILEAIRTLLSKTSLDATLKEKLTQRALNSENDIAQDHLFTKEEITKETDDFLTK